MKEESVQINAVDDMYELDEGSCMKQGIRKEKNGDEGD
jgi:hypothetical protein